MNQGKANTAAETNATVSSDPDKEPCACTEQVADAACDIHGVKAFLAWLVDSDLFEAEVTE